MTQLGEIIRKENPDYVLVQGDRTTGMAAALAAFYQKVKIAHIEAGLRTWNKLQPFPEEINRRIIDAISDLCFAYTQEAKRNLLREGISPEKIEVVHTCRRQASLDKTKEGIRCAHFTKANES